jgi:hypothetical protein
MDFSLPDNILVLQLAKEFYVDEYGTVRLKQQWKSKTSLFLKDEPLGTSTEKVKKEQFFSMLFYLL